VSPLSYHIKETLAIHRPFEKVNYRGKFTRDTSERLTCSRFYLPNNDVTPAPTETGLSFKEERQHHLSKFLKETAIEEVNLNSDWSRGVRLRNLPVIKDSA